jgi:hypothetical protein
MLDPQIVVNLFPELDVGMNLAKHGNWLWVKDSCVARNTFFNAAAEWSTCDAAVSECQQPIERTPKGPTHLLALCSTPGQLNHFVALALQ